jgi:transposase
MTSSDNHSTSNDARRPPSWDAWVAAHGDVLARLTAPQRALVEAAVRLVVATEGHSIMRRVAAFFLLHAGMQLSPAQVGVAVGRTDRALRTVQALSARGFLESVWGELGRHRQPKLSAEHAGPIAKYLIDHPGCTQAEMVGHIRASFNIVVDPLTLRRFFKKYGRGVLRKGSSNEKEDEPRPFASDGPGSVGPSSSSRRRSR